MNSFVHRPTTVVTRFSEILREVPQSTLDIVFEEMREVVVGVLGNTNIIVDNVCDFYTSLLLGYSEMLAPLFGGTETHISLMADVLLETDGDSETSSVIGVGDLAGHNSVDLAWALASAFRDTVHQSRLYETWWGVLGGLGGYRHPQHITLSIHHLSCTDAVVEITPYVPTQNLL